jgi:hypothetical protein
MRLLMDMMVLAFQTDSTEDFDLSLSPRWQ